MNLITDIVMYGLLAVALYWIVCILVIVWEKFNDEIW